MHSRHRSITNFLVNLVAVLGAYCFFENKPDALQGYYIEDSILLACMGNLSRTQVYIYKVTIINIYSTLRYPSVFIVIIVTIVTAVGGA